MIIRYFVYSKEDSDALNVVENSLSAIKDDILNKKYYNIESYWKFEGTYVVELKLKIKDSHKNFEQFLNSISDCWITNDIIDEIFAAQNEVRCHFKNERIEFIIIYFSESEYNFSRKLKDNIKFMKIRD